MFKKACIVLLAAISVLTMAACGKAEELSTMEKIQKTLNEMESYSCQATLTRISNKGENVYETNQYFKSTGEYKLELTSPENAAGNYTVFDGNQICQYSKSAGDKVITDVPDSQQRNELFLGQFIKNYMQSEEVSIEVAKLDKSKCTVLEAVIPGGNKYLATEKLWIDNETLKPVQLIIYDNEGGERYIITYNEFEYNAPFDDNFFKIN